MNSRGQGRCNNKIEADKQLNPQPTLLIEIFFLCQHLKPYANVVSRGARREAVNLSETFEHLIKERQLTTFIKSVSEEADPKRQTGLLLHMLASV